ncbi:hypothetical protein ABZP36_004511 [Zizania latifolia]
MPEAADFLHVYDASAGYAAAQEINLFGEIAGMAFSQGSNHRQGSTGWATVRTRTCGLVGEEAGEEEDSREEKRGGNGYGCGRGAAASGLPVSADPSRLGGMGPMELIQFGTSTLSRAATDEDVTLASRVSA